MIFFITAPSTIWYSFDFKEISSFIGKIQQATSVAIWKLYLKYTPRNITRFSLNCDLASLDCAHILHDNYPVTGGFPSQRASNAENVSMWWRLHGKQRMHISCHIPHYNGVHVLFVLMLLESVDITTYTKIPWYKVWVFLPLRISSTEITWNISIIIKYIPGNMRSCHIIVFSYDCIAFHESIICRINISL